MSEDAPRALRVTSSLAIPYDELEWRFSGSGGPGGQHRNKTQNAVRLHHAPSGVVIGLPAASRL